MNEDIKQLIRSDIYARLAYGPIKGRITIEVPDGTYDINSGHMEYSDMPVDVELYSVNEDEAVICPIDSKSSIMVDILVDNNHFTIFDFTPYLHPMSSMTEEEKEEFDNLYNWSCPNSKFLRTKIIDVSELIDWLNENHFDYRGLIKKGLALEVPEGMYN